MPDKKPRNLGEPVGEHVRISLRGKMWQATYQLDGKQVRESLKTRNKKQAVKEAMKIEVRLQEGTQQVRRETKSIDEAIALFLAQVESKGSAKKTITKYKRVMSDVAALAKILRRTKVSHLDLLFVDRYKRARVENAKEAGTKIPGLETLGDDVTIIHSFTLFCLRRKLIAEDPLEGLHNPKPKPQEQPCWSWNQVQKILNACPEEIKPAMSVLAYCGLRCAELRHLTWSDIDLENNVVRIRPKPEVGWKPKSKDQRAVPMPTQLKEVLLGLPKDSYWAFTMPLTKQQHIAGKQWSAKRLLERLRTVLKKLGLRGHKHTFRHSLISHAIAMGTPPAMVQKWAGHLDAKILALYTHLHDDQSQDAMQRLMSKPITRPAQGGEEKKSA